MDQARLRIHHKTHGMWGLLSIVLGLGLRGWFPWIFRDQTRIHYKTYGVWGLWSILKGLGARGWFPWIFMDQAHRESTTKLMVCGVYRLLLRGGGGKEVVPLNVQGSDSNPSQNSWFVGFMVVVLRLRG